MNFFTNNWRLKRNDFFTNNWWLKEKKWIYLLITEDLKKEMNFLLITETKKKWIFLLITED